MHVPQVALFATTILSGIAADWVQSEKQVSTVRVRKFFNTVAFTIAGIFLILTGWVSEIFPADQQTLGAVAFISIAQGGMGMSVAGFNVNHLDIGPRYAGVMMGITNTAGTISGILGPVVTGWLTPCGMCDDTDSVGYNYYWEGPLPCPPLATRLVPDNSHAFPNFANVSVGYHQCRATEVEAQWRNVFYLTSGLCLLGALCFLVCASGEVQAWNSPSVKGR
eukprot:m.194426 g.194426  ORF g.194426 m.194426 type:complete len:222 (-) comp18649_c2_seq2:383-1048(-)